MTSLLIAFAFVCLLGFGHALGLAAHSVCLDTRQNRRAEEKARALLRSWLTPQQAKQWDSRKEFYVIGSHTGTRYRIRRGTAMNIDELDSRGRVVTQWCFAPQKGTAEHVISRYSLNRYPTPCSVSIMSNESSTCLNFLRTRLTWLSMVRSST
jgi:hypothetical protein